MRYLFIHPVFPGQFGKLMETLAADPRNEVRHLSRQSAVAALPGVRKFQYRFEPAPVPAGTHPFLQKLHQGLQEADAITRALLQLRRQGYRPDLIYGYTGSGHTLFVKDVYPEVPFVGYFEWFLHAFGAEYNFDPDYPLDFEHQRALRLANANALLDLHHCDAGVTPTQWQLQQFPPGFRDKLRVIHDGVDTAFYRPAPVEALAINGRRLELDAVEIVTYTTRGMEPFRGFPQFMRALPRLMAARPRCHVVIAGTEDNYYSRARPDGLSYKQALLQELDGRIDPSRLHFTGWLAGEAYRNLLRASSAHVYFTYPYVLSWSLVEALSTGCQVIGSRTPPVQEAIRHGENGLLVDFFDVDALAETLVAALEDVPRAIRLRAAARATVEEHYALERVLPLHAGWVRDWAQAARPH